MTLKKDIYYRGAKKASQIKKERRLNAMWFKRIFASVLSAACLCGCFAVPAYAESAAGFSLVSGISPLYDIAENVFSELIIVGTSAECRSQADGIDDVKITVEQTLQKHWGLWIWNDVEGATWTKTVNDNSIFLSNTKSGLDSGTYRVKSVFTLTDKNGKSETITIYSEKETVG